jgi:hypothetical protein
MLRFDYELVRSAVPEKFYDDVWQQEAAYLGLPDNLNKELPFHHAALQWAIVSGNGKLWLPHKKGVSVQTSKEARDIEWYAAFILYGKVGYLGINEGRFFAGLPEKWFSKIALRELTEEEQDMVLGARNRKSRYLTQGEREVMLALLLVNNLKEVVATPQSTRPRRPMRKKREC